MKNAISKFIEIKEKFEGPLAVLSTGALAIYHSRNAIKKIGEIIDILEASKKA